MIKKRILQLALILFTVIVVYNVYKHFEKRKKDKEYQEWVASLVHTASPNVQILKDTITIDYLNEKRTLSLYLPADYEKDTLSYPVIYFMDGNSLFDEKILVGHEWQVDEVLDSLGHLGLHQAIVVGIYNSEENRLTEYKPFRSPRLPKEKKVTGEQHAEWIATDVKQWVDSRYRTQKGPASTVIGGASLGGLMSYYMLMKYPDIYGGAIVFSPSFWVNDKVYELHKSVADLSEKRIYFDAGELETPTVKSIKKMHELLVKNGMPKSNLKLDVEEGEGHWHLTWRKGFPKAYPWIFDE